MIVFTIEQVVRVEFKVIEALIKQNLGDAECAILIAYNINLKDPDTYRRFKGKSLNL